MKAIVCKGTGGVSVMHWVDCPMPQIGDDEVLIKVAAAGVSRPDVLQRMGAYEPPADASPILGLEVAGEIIAGAGMGRKVCALVHGGGYAEYVRVKAAHCLPVPDGWTMVEAAGLPETFFTVWLNVFEKACLGQAKPETLLVHAGASGIGLAAIQMARAMGQTVCATASSEAKRQACLTYGAHRVFDVHDDWASQINADVVLDMLAGDWSAQHLKVLNQNGRLVWIAFLAGQKTELNVAQVMGKELQITGSFLRRQSDEVKAHVAVQLQQQIWPHLNHQRIRPMIDSVYPIQNVAAAHDRLHSRLNIGKIILQVDAS